MANVFFASSVEVRVGDTILVTVLMVVLHNSDNSGICIQKPSEPHHAPHNHQELQELVLIGYPRSLRRCVGSADCWCLLHLRYQAPISTLHYETAATERVPFLILLPAEPCPY